MKQALLIYESINQYFNIGDYIQSLAANQFLYDEPIFINREKLSRYDGEEVKLIMNGWFLHQPKNWPPSYIIKPLFVSFHLNSTAYEILESNEVIEYFKKNEPIGCRDLNTMHKLKEFNIEAYFTGCLTLTLGERYKSVEKTNEIIFVDPYFEINFKLKNILKSISNILMQGMSMIKLNRKLNKKFSIKNIIKTTFFYQNYLKLLNKEQILNAKFTHHYLPENQFSSEKEKFEYAQILVDTYSKAKLVITSRIHCALPSVGMETPVIYINKLNDEEISTCRLDGILEFLNVVNYSNGIFTSNDVNINKIKDLNIRNKDSYTTYKDRLVEKCKSFIIH